MKRLVTIILFLAMASSFAFAQIQYKLTTATATYAGNTAGQQFTWTGSPDEGYTAPVLIGFPFTYDGIVRDTFQVTTNGILRFGSTLASATLTNALNGLTRSVVAPLWDDLKASDSSLITYQLTGIAPNRVLTVEWKSIYFPYNNTVPNANFSVKLYETTNLIELVYGSYIVQTSATATSASIGLSNSLPILTANQATGQFLSINVAGIAGARSFHQSMGEEFNGISVLPDSGTVLRFTPQTPVPMSGPYTVGGGGASFATLSDAAMALNRNGVSGPVTMTVNSGTYDDVFHLINVAGTSSTNTITLVSGGTVVLSPRNGSYATATPGAASGDAFIRLEGSQYVTIDGLHLMENLDNITTRTKFNMGVLNRNAVYPVAGVTTFIGAKYNTFKNLMIDLNAMNGAANVGAIGIRFGTQGTNTTDTLGANSYNTIENCSIEDYWRAGIQMYGFAGVTNPDKGNKIIGTNGGFTELKNVLLNSGSSNDSRSIELNAEYDITIENVKITNIDHQVATTNQTYGIWGNPANSATDGLSGNVVIRNVIIDGLSSSNPLLTTGLTVAIGMNRLVTGSTLTIENCKISNVFSSGTTSARAIGMLLNVGPVEGNVTAKLYNNTMYNLRAPLSTAATTVTGPPVQGINVQASVGACAYELFYNTILLDGNTAPGLASMSSANLFWGNFANGTLDLRNNIFVNMTQSGTGRNAVLMATTNANLLKLAATSNNNLYYADTAQVDDVIAYDFTTEFVSLADYKTAVAPREVNSVTEMVPFMSYAAPVNIRMNKEVTTLANGGALPIAGITTDAYGNVRDLTTPDIGAEEFTTELNAPTGLLAVSNNPAYVQLSWTDNTTAETGYYVERKNGDSTSVNAYTVIQTLIAGATVTRDSTVVPLTIYTYRVRAFNTTLFSPSSNQATVTTMVPVELASYSVTAVKNNVNIEWSTASETNASHFIVERKLSDGEWMEAASIKAAGTSTTIKSYSVSDRNVATGKYSYRLKQVDFDGTSETFTAIEVEVGVPTAFDMSQNYPNPFNPSTKIDFSIPVPANVTLDIFDISGQKVATVLSGQMNAGYHFVNIDAAKYGMSSGTYVYRLSADKFTSIKKMILVK
ncbi:hypothetical protein MASR2M39_02370 [Ignavibacteriales bacterium]